MEQSLSVEEALEACLRAVHRVRGDLACEALTVTAGCAEMAVGKHKGADAALGAIEDIRNRWLRAKDEEEKRQAIETMRSA